VRFWKSCVRFSLFTSPTKNIRQKSPVAYTRNPASRYLGSFVFHQALDGHWHGCQNPEPPALVELCSVHDDPNPTMLPFRDLFRPAASLFPRKQAQRWTAPPATYPCHETTFGDASCSTRCVPYPMLLIPHRPFTSLAHKHAARPERRQRAS